MTESWDATGNGAMGSEVQDERSVGLQNEMLENEVGGGRSCVTGVKTGARGCGKDEAGQTMRKADEREQAGLVVTPTKRATRRGATDVKHRTGKKTERRL